MAKKTTTRTRSVRMIEPADAFNQFDPRTTRWNPQNARALVYASDLAYKDSDSIKAAAAAWVSNAAASVIGRARECFRP